MEINPGDFFLPWDRPYFTREELKRVMEAPGGGVKLVRAGRKGSPDHDVIRFSVRPYDDRQFRAWAFLEKPTTPEQVRVADEVIRKLEAERPVNPGRVKYYPTWTTTTTYHHATPPGRGLPLDPIEARRIQPREISLRLVHAGWSMLIRKLETTADGWKATVEVTPLARTEYYERADVSDKHFEEYTYKDGKLTLERDYLPLGESVQGRANGLRSRVYFQSEPRGAETL